MPYSKAVYADLNGSRFYPPGLHNTQSFMPIQHARQSRCRHSSQTKSSSPSISMSGAFWPTSASTFLIFSPDAELPDPKFERDNSATFGDRFNHAICAAAAIVNSAICSAVGSSLTWRFDRCTFRALCDPSKTQGRRLKPISGTGVPVRSGEAR